MAVAFILLLASLSRFLSLVFKRKPRWLVNIVGNEFIIGLFQGRNGGGGGGGGGCKQCRSPRKMSKGSGAKILGAKLIYS